MFDPLRGKIGGMGSDDREELLAWAKGLRVAMSRRFPAGPETVALSLAQALDGKLRSVGQFTMTALTASSILTDARIAPNSFIDFSPRTASAGTEKAGGAMYVMTQSNGSATIAHSNITAPDRIFTYAVLGG